MYNFPSKKKSSRIHLHSYDMYNFPSKKKSSRRYTWTLTHPLSSWSPSPHLPSVGMSLVIRLATGSTWTGGHQSGSTDPTIKPMVNPTAYHGSLHLNTLVRLFTGDLKSKKNNKAGNLIPKVRCIYCKNKYVISSYMMCVYIDVYTRACHLYSYIYI